MHLKQEMQIFKRNETTVPKVNSRAQTLSAAYNGIAFNCSRASEVWKVSGSVLRT